VVGVPATTTLGWQLTRVAVGCGEDSVPTNVEPVARTATHSVAELQETPVNTFPTPDNRSTVELPGTLGLNVASCPLLSTAVHCVPEGHATALRWLPVSIAEGVGVPGELGLNVTSCPLLSTAVHCVPEGHATAYRVLPTSIVAGVGVPGELGLNVTSWP